MGIDRIGNPSSPPPSLEDGAPSLDSTAQANAANPSAGLGHAGAVETQAPEARTVADSGSILGRLERGEVTREQYVDYRIDEAVAPFTSRLSEHQLTEMRAVLRDRLESDPTVAELLRRATAGAAQK